MYEFYKNSQGETIEGYLGATDKFNGIVFLLREPNTNEKENSNNEHNINKAEEFWFKKVLYNSEAYHKELETKNEDLKKITNSKRASVKYINRFNEMLESTGFNKDDLFNAIFCNTHPEYGETSATSEYQKTMEVQATSIINHLSSIHNNLYIFTCNDIYDCLKNHLKPVREEKGLRYKRKVLNCFQAETNSCKITIYKIYHPSFSGKIIKPITSP